jgi:CRISPR/Cas system-associated protein Csm6
MNGWFDTVMNWISDNVLNRHAAQERIMEAMQLLHERSSMGKLTGPAPSAEQLEAIYRAALRAPDHK